MKQKKISWVNPLRKENKLRFLIFWGLGLLVLAAGLMAWKEWTEQFARWTPDYALVTLPEFSSVESLSQEELALIYAQTGLSEVGLERLEEAGRLEELAVFQRAYFLEAVEVQPEEAVEFSLPFDQLPMSCWQNSPISWEEYLLSPEGYRGAYLPMVPLELGDILLTPNSHTYGWRQGHAALVVDLDEWQSLESMVLGENSKLQYLSKWQGFPAVVILRPVEAELGQVAAEYALDFLVDVPYDLTVGVLSAKNQPLGEISGTHCAHLVWQAYQWAGLDIDSNGGAIIAPQEIVGSQALEVVQIWGVNPQVLWSYSNLNKV